VVISLAPHHLGECMARQHKTLGTFHAIWPPVLLALVGIPLALELVVPNAFYGVRNAATLASPERWYRSNFYAGVAAVLGGAVALFANLSIVRSNRLSEAQKWWRTLAVTMMAVAAMIIAGLAAA
jgi:uncharacterized membrane protein